MLTPPAIPTADILAHLRESYALDFAQVEFLPLGADIHTAVYRAETRESVPYFLKLRTGAFDEISLALPAYLRAQGIDCILAPLATRSGGLWSALSGCQLALYPFIAGQNGYEVALSDTQWAAFGAALARVHAAQPPDALAARIRRETFSPRHRQNVASWLSRLEGIPFSDPVAARLSAFFQARRDEITGLLARSEALATDLRSHPPAFVLCHADIHPGNLLISPRSYCCDRSGRFYLVDWDAPLFAPPERDLLLIGGCTTWSDPRQSALFYRGYTARTPHPARTPDLLTLAYYRYERVIEDLSAYCDQVFSSDEGGDDRQQSYIYCTSNFLPGHEIDLARQVDQV